VVGQGSLANHEKDHIDTIRKEILKDQNSRLWRDFTNSLKLISQVVFTRSSGFILEFIQNAEDSKGNPNEEGYFKIVFKENSIEITHNGHPFTDSDVESLCGIRSSKKPENGSLGYLGIGFKSVFKISDSPEIYSNGYSFKFDKNYEEWRDQENFPWGITPIWIETQPRDIDKALTTFIIPLRNKEDLKIIKSEVNKLSPEIFLYLKWIRKIEIIDETSGYKKILQNLGESGNIIKLSCNSVCFTQ